MVTRNPTSISTRDLLDDPDAFLEKLESVPFVNGGLFDCLDDAAGNGTAGRRMDAFSDDIENEGQDLCVPACLFFGECGLFTLLRRYKFTVEENTPLDQEVALDPELLGQVFENLLAAYNPETRETARKATGSYYTPRHVVDYMVDETLATALMGKSGSTNSDDTERERLRRLLDHERAFEDGQDALLPRRKEGCGPGDRRTARAGPGGWLRRFSHERAAQADLGAKAARPRQCALGKAAERARQEKWRAIRYRASKDREGARGRHCWRSAGPSSAYRDSDFGRKLYLMQNGIFGVDIQPIACQIAKLRFFISLIVEQTPNEDLRKNYGVRPLPNLETRIVAANALIGAREHRKRSLRIRRCG